MHQAELPLVYESVHSPISRINYRLPLRWKAVFILLIIYTIIASALIFGKFTQTHAETAPTQVETLRTYVNNVQAPEEKVLLPAGAAQVTMTATVPGWYDVVEVDNENLLLKTNMRVWVNGREFTRCGDSDQDTAYPELLDF